MRHALPTTLALAAAAAALAGCSTRPAVTRQVQPIRTLDEMYAVQSRVNTEADTYELGTGDAIGHMTFGTFRARTLTAAAQE